MSNILKFGTTKTQANMYALYIMCKRHIEESGFWFMHGDVPINETSWCTTSHEDLTWKFEQLPHNAHFSMEICHNEGSLLNAEIGRIFVSFHIVEDMMGDLRLSMSKFETSVKMADRGVRRFWFDSIRELHKLLEELETQYG